jgi:hypothetical protein
MNKNMYHVLSLDDENNDNIDNHDNHDNINIDNNNIMNDNNIKNFYRNKIIQQNDNNDNDNDNNDNNNDYHNNENTRRRYKIPIKKSYKNNQNYKYNNDKLKKYNQKKILCQNFITYNSCIYEDKCSYAHNLNEQNIDPFRKQILDIITGTQDLEYLTKDLHQFKLITKELLIFTKLCDNCIINKCIGGYNCKNGSCKKDFLLCYEDLNYGSCKNNLCVKIHLSKRNMKPLQNQLYYTFNNYTSTFPQLMNKNGGHLEYKNIDTNLLIKENIDKYDNIQNINNDTINNILNTLIDMNTIQNNHSITNLLIYDDTSSDEDCEHSIFEDRYKNLDLLISSDDQ